MSKCGKCSPGGSSADDPLVFGKRNDAPPVRVVLQIVFWRRRIGDVVWATGAAVDAMVAAGHVARVVE